MTKSIAHRKLLNDALEAIGKVHSDVGVSLETTLDSLEEISSLTTGFIEAVQNDLARAEDNEI